MSSYPQSSWPQWAYTSEVNDQYSNYGQYPSYSSYLADSMEAYQAHHHHLVHHHQMSRTTESKPRLSKEEVEILEAEFQKNHKPNSSTKKALAESMRVDNARINNWFQNRRAREKKERNIREYEARQKLEKEKTQPDGHRSIHPDRVSDLVASSAPFPNVQDSTQSGQVKREGSYGLEHDSEAASSYLSDENAGPGHVPGAYLRGPSMQSPGSFVSRHANGTSPSNDASDANDPDFALSTDDEDPNYYVHQIHQTARGGGESRRGNSGLNDIGDRAFVDEDDTAADIASRRNRRPPPLAIGGGSRSYSVGVPKTAVDASRRADSMRRVASATGPMRITKSMAAPRSPYPSSRSPAPSAPRGSNAPPTPDTPILANQPGSTSTTSLESGNAISVSELAIRDPTLRTPPTTPGGMPSFFSSLDSVYTMPISSQSMVAPGISSFQSDYDNKLSVGVSSYAIHPSSGASQPQTPSFVSPGTQPSFGLGGGNGTEYNWPEPVGSRNSSSPVAQQTAPQFIAMPAPSFGMLGR